MRTLDSVIADSPVFTGLDDEQLELIAGCASNVVFPAGAQIFREGAEADHFFLVRHGRVALDQFVPNRGRMTVETVGEGEIVGWSWLVPPYRWQLSARAVELVRAVQFDGACLRGKCDEDAQLGYVLLQRFSQPLVERLQAARIQLLDMYGDGSAN